MRIVVITPIPTPYRDPCWDKLASLPDTNLTVIYCATGKSDRPWDSNTENFAYAACFPAGKNLFRRLGWGRSCYWNPEVKSLLSSCSPDVVLVGGYNHLTMLAAASYCRRRGVPWLLMCESWKKDSGMRGAVKTGWKKWLLSTAAGMLPTGSRAASNGERLGIPVSRQCLFPNVPDIQRLQTLSSSLQEKREAVRTTLGVAPNQKLLVFAARMIEKKRPRLVIESFLKLTDFSTTLAMIGDGPMLQDLKSFVQKTESANRVLFPGFLSPEQVHEWMAVADLYVQPSRETWGVAPIEALACGTPVVLSSETGCVDDILTSPAVGERLSHNTVEELAAAIHKVLAGQHSHEDIVEAWRPWAEGNTHQKLASRLRTFLDGIISRESN